MVSTASTNALPMNCPWRNKLSPSPRPRRGVHIVKVCPVDNIYLLCYTATCLSSIAGAGYSSPFPSHQGVHTRWFGRALEWHSRGQRFDPAYLHQLKSPNFFPLGKRVRAFRLYYRFEEEKRMLKKIKIILSIISIILNLALIVMLVNYQEEEE